MWCNKYHLLSIMTHIGIYIDQSLLHIWWYFFFYPIHDLIYKTHACNIRVNYPQTWYNWLANRDTFLFTWQKYLLKILYSTSLSPFNLEKRVFTHCSFHTNYLNVTFFSTTFCNAMNEWKTHCHKLLVDF